MSEIKRYDFFNDAHGHEMPGAEMRDGEWVRYTDHLAAVEAAVMAEREAIAADAARYRFLRPFEVDSYLACGSGEKLDAEIDEAIRARTTQPAKEST